MFLKAICKSIGHNWSTTDYTNSIKANGERYEFTTKRECHRCNKVEYLFNEWIAEENVLEKIKDNGFGTFN